MLQPASLGPLELPLTTLGHPLQNLVEKVVVVVVGKPFTAALPFHTKEALENYRVGEI